MAIECPLSSAAFEISMARVVFPVPMSPVNQIPLPAARFSSSFLMNCRTRCRVVSDMSETTLQRVRQFIRKLDENLAAGRGIWFTGDIGTGKTTLAMLISKAALESGHSIAIYSMPKLLARIRRTFDGQPGGDSYSEFFEKLTSVDLLHIDDVGAERQTEWVLEQFYSIVNERYEAQKSIMFTTNSESMQPAKGEGHGQFKVEEQINPRTFSRLTEMCGDPILMFGEDNRAKMIARDP